MTAPLPSIIATRYRVIKEIGRGGMGVVYLVKHENTGEYHALKVLREQELGGGEALERFRREMRIPAKIRSEHIAKVTDADVAPELGGVPFLVMELLNGCDLGKILTKCGARYGDEVAWILGQTAKALEKAHALEVVHRDLKPENIFIHMRDDGSFVAKVLDFGVAKVKEDIRRSNPSAKRHINTENIIGTPLYMSPEQARGPAPNEPPIGFASDIWSMGMMTYELLTSEPYWQADNVMDLLGQIFFGKMVPPSERSPLLTPKFDHWFARSCDRDPANRWVSASKQFDALLDALNIKAIPSEIPAKLARHVAVLTPLPLEEVARDEPSLYRIVGPRLPERSDDTLKDTGGGVKEHKLSSAPSSRDAGSIPQATAPPLNDAGLALAATLPGNPLATDGDSAPTPSVALQNHQAPPGTPAGRAPGKLPVAGQRENAGSTSAMDVPTHVVSSQGDEPPTLPTGRNQGPTVVAGAPLGSSLRKSASLQSAENVPAAAPRRRLPQMMPMGLALCLVFILGLVVGLAIMAR